jgi:hypothetical protein
MKKLGKASFVVVAISEKYVKSEYCMFELYELYRNSSLEQEQLIKKIYPIKVEELDLNSLEFLEGLTTYWEDLLSKSDKLAKKFPDRYQRIKNINNELGKLIEFLGDINSSTAAILSSNDFAEIKTAMQRRVVEFSQR